MKWLYKLEYKYGRYYIRRLMTIIIAGMAIVYLAQMMMPTVNIAQYLTLNRTLLFQGQVWRLITFLFVPPSSGNPFFLLISLYFYYMMGNNLESLWGGFKFNVYYLVGVLGAIVCALIFGYTDNTYLNLSLFLAFATVAPDTTFLLFFIIPLKAKWMAIAYAVLMVLSVISSFVYSPMAGLVALASLAFSLVNYLLFFGRGLVDTIQNQIRIYKNRRNWNNRNR